VNKDSRILARKFQESIGGTGNKAHVSSLLRSAFEKIGFTAIYKHGTA
jgi:hypothetical protein